MNSRQFACTLARLFSPLSTWIVLILIIKTGDAQAEMQTATLRGAVTDENGAPVSGVEVAVRTPEGRILKTLTGEAGRFSFDSIPVGKCSVSLNKFGFFKPADLEVEVREGSDGFAFTLNHETEINEEIQVSSSSNPVEAQETAHQETLVAREVRDLPVPSSHDLKSALPELPGVVVDNSGQLHVAGGRVGEAVFQLDGFEIGDPVTGDLTTRVNVDSVRAVDVVSGPYGTQYASGGAGVLSIDTIVGDDKFRIGATNFVPPLSIQRGIHLGNYYPRFTFSGPIEKGRAWFSDAVSLQHTFTLFTELPQNQDSIRQWSGDNLLRAQVNLSPKHLLQASFLYNQQSISNFGLGPFSPQSTTTDLRTHQYFVSMKDQILWGRNVVELGVAGFVGRNASVPKGSQPYVITPASKTGNYFEGLHERTDRWQVLASITRPSSSWHGRHDLQAGFDFAKTAWDHSSSRTSIDVERLNGALIQHSSFLGPTDFHLTDTRIGGYFQDSWRIFKPLQLQIGLRAQKKRIAGQWVAAPRLALSYLPFHQERSRFTAAWGIYCPPAALAIFGPGYDQQRLDTFYDYAGSATVIGPVKSRFVVPQGGLEQPRFLTTSIEWIQKVQSKTFAVVNYVRRSEHFGFAYENLQPDQLGGVFELQNNRKDNYQAVQFSLRRTYGERAEISAGYTRSRARSNEALDYSLATPVFAPQQPGPLTWDAPNRVVSSGWAPLPFWRLLISYFLEYRTGFPFSVVNQRQELIGTPNHLRFPDYLSLNVGVEKRFRLLGHEWAIRLAGTNVLDRSNPNAVINNVDVPYYLTFRGGQHRALSARLRLVG